MSHFVHCPPREGRIPSIVNATRLTIAFLPAHKSNSKGTTACSFSASTS